MVQLFKRKVFASVLPLFCQLFSQEAQSVNELVISTYIQILQEALIEHNKQEAAGSFLLDSIAKQEIANVVTDLSAKK